MGSGGSKKSTPKIVKGFRPESEASSPASSPETRAVTSSSSSEATDSQVEEGYVVVDKTGTETPIGQEEAVDEGDDTTEGFVKSIDGKSTSPWPYRNFLKLDVNINGQHGGGAGLLLISDKYGGKGEETNAEIFLIRSGFDCNHFSTKSLSRDHQGHFGPENIFETDEQGIFVVDALFGDNNARLLSNDSCYGNLRECVFVESVEGVSPTPLPLNINGDHDGEKGAGVSILVCSAVENNSLISASYAIRSGFSGNKYGSKLFSGEDKFKLSEVDGILHVQGPAGARYGLIHNRNNLVQPTNHAFVSQIQAVNGKQAVILCKKLPEHASFLVLCSASNGSEGSTASAVYFVTVYKNEVVSSTEIGGLAGHSYTTSDLWTFKVNNKQLEVTGPENPCKYGLLSNIATTPAELRSSVQPAGCIATGEVTRTHGKAKVTWDKVTGEVNKCSPIQLMWNQKKIGVISDTELQKQGGMFTFSYSWPETEKVVGHHMIRVFAVREHRTTGEDVLLELTGSPCPLIQQKKGVAFAVNCGGPAYQALNDVVYTSEFGRFANFDSKVFKGKRFLSSGAVKVNGNLPNSLLNSDDGFLYTRVRVAHDADDSNLYTYKLNDIPNGEYIFRYHSSVITKDMSLNGNDITKKIADQILKQKTPTDIENFTCYMADAPVQVNSNTFLLTANQYDTSFRHMEKIGAWALLNKATYKEKCVTAAQKQEHNVEQQKLADVCAPLSTSVTRKEMKIVGWSPNLLQNSSSELGSMKHWNTTGDFKIEDGGYGTEKCIKASHMWCEKYQEVNLLDHFTAEYLDTAPDIQVLEMYREGHCGGGFYVLTAQLLTEDGQVIEEYTTGEIGTIYKEAQWQEASHVFTGYKPGVRIVGFSSKGKDDKFWAGHFGPVFSGACVRVKRETQHAAGDEYCDISVDDMQSNKTAMEKLVNQIIGDNQELMKDFFIEENLPMDEAFEKQTEPVRPSSAVGKNKKPRHRKKREIRVFVSSTFRDFSKEREEIIKKAFREINRICSDRGVFFTYVDLRWGITSDQTNDGKTIAICLQEIDRCRPYFICLMGERFGWSQKSNTKDEILNMTFDYAIDNHPNMNWIDKFRYDGSVTQLEVFHGVLNGVLNKPGEKQDKSFFYMREPVAPESVDPTEYKRLAPESDWHKERQDWLRDEVMKHKDKVNIETFQTATQVADLIKRDLERCVDEDFPLGTELTKLEQQREAHNAFAAARVRVYIGRQEYFTNINNARDQELKQPFVLLGESGCGKSALVANWVKRVEDSEPDTFMFFHFIGSSADSANYLKLIRRLYEELKTYFNFDLQIPSSDAHLINELGKWLRLAGTRAKVVLVFDALNQLDDGSGRHDGAEHDLLWIPAVIPPNVFLLVSTLPGRAMNACKERDWPSMKVEPLADPQKEQIITDYLEGIYGKTLTQDQKDMIVNAQQTSNALYLKSLLDEVRMYGSFRTLTDKIKDYLTAINPGDLFAKILERLEDDFEKGPSARENMVRDATSALWCANRGMSETELMELLDVKGAIWSPFYLSLYENLVNRDGILNFFHDHLRQAVEKKYLSTSEEKRLCYLRLADYHSAQEISGRTVEELPFLLAKAGEMQRLKETISNLKVFYRLSDNEDGIFELVKAWRHLGDFSLVEKEYFAKLSEISKEEMYKDADYYCKLYSKLGSFFQTLGLTEAAKNVFQTLIDQLEHQYKESHGTIVYSAHSQSYVYRCKHPVVIQALQDLGTVYCKMAEYDKAIETYNDAINRQNRVETPTQKLQLTEGLLGLATVYIAKDNMAEAKKLLSRSLELATDIFGKNHHFVASIFTRLGQLSYKQGRIDETLAYCMQDLKVTRSEVGVSHPRTAIVLNEIALVYDDKNDDLAGKLYEAALLITLETYGRNYVGTAIIRYNLGAFYFGTNHFSRAKYQFEESYKVLKMFLGEDHVDTKAAKLAMENVGNMYPNSKMDMDKRKLDFYCVAHLSNCIGAVDVTLVAIQAPPVSTELPAYNWWPHIIKSCCILHIWPSSEDRLILTPVT